MKWEQVIPNVQVNERRKQGYAFLRCSIHVNYAEAEFRFSWRCLNRALASVCLKKWGHSISTPVPGPHGAAHVLALSAGRVKIAQLSQGSSWSSCSPTSWQQSLSPPHLCLLCKAFPAGLGAGVQVKECMYDNIVPCLNPKTECIDVLGMSTKEKIPRGENLTLFYWPWCHPRLDGRGTPLGCCHLSAWEIEAGNPAQPEEPPGSRGGSAMQKNDTAFIQLVYSQWPGDLRGCHLV